MKSVEVEAVHLKPRDSNDNTAIYVVGGLVIGGILLYALVLKQDKKVKQILQHL